MILKIWVEDGVLIQAEKLVNLDCKSSRETPTKLLRFLEISLVTANSAEANLNLLRKRYIKNMKITTINILKP